MNLGTMDALSAELWSIWKGLEFAWNRGLQRVALDSDSKEALSHIYNGIPKRQGLDPLIQKIREMLNRDWEAKLSHSLREANDVAYRLALSTLDTARVLQVMESPPEDVRLLLLEDLKRSGVSRCVSVGLV